MLPFMNDDPFQPWNGISADDPNAPHNGIDGDDPMKPWNNPFGSREDLSERDRAWYDRNGGGW